MHKVLGGKPKCAYAIVFKIDCHNFVLTVIQLIQIKLISRRSNLYAQIFGIGNRSKVIFIINYQLFMYDMLR